MPAYCALMADRQTLLAGRAALAAPLRFWTATLEGWAAWQAPASLDPLVLSAGECRRLRCPFCESRDSRDLVRPVGEEVGPLVEDWGSPHLDLHAAREGYVRSTPSPAHVLPPGEEPA